MRFCTKYLFLLLLVASVAPSLRAQDYSIEELNSEETTSARPFSIVRVERADQGLRLFLSTDNPAEVATLVSSGAFQAQLSDHNSETEMDLPLSYKKAVWCSKDDRPVYLSFKDPLPSCNEKPPARIEYFFEASAVLGADRDLSIGQDPDYLWLIEER